MRIFHAVFSLASAPSFRFCDKVDEQAKSLPRSSKQNVREWQTLSPASPLSFVAFRPTAFFSQRARPRPAKSMHSLT